MLGIDPNTNFVYSLKPHTIMCEVFFLHKGHRKKTDRKFRKTDNQRFVKNLTIALNLLLLTNMITNYQINDIIPISHLK